MKVVLTKRCVDLMEKGLDPKRAAQSSLDYMNDRVSGRGGLVSVSSARGRQIQVGVHFTTPRMPWAVADVDNKGQPRVIDAGIDEPPREPISVGTTRQTVPPLSVVGLGALALIVLSVSMARRARGA